MALLDRLAILQARTLPQESVSVPEWGGDVFVRTLTAKELDDFQAANIQGSGKDRKPNLQNFRARLAVRCIVDADGKRLFEDTDAEALGAASCRAIDRVFAVAQRLNGMTDESTESIAKNSETALSGGSPSV
jgi:hypothetical protein